MYLVPWRSDRSTFDCTANVFACVVKGTAAARYRIAPRREAPLIPAALHSANRFARVNPMVVVARGASGGLGMTMSSKSAAAGTGVPQSAALLPTLTRPAAVRMRTRELLVVGQVTELRRCELITNDVAEW